MEQASVFRSNKSQAVRLPKPVTLPESVKKIDIRTVSFNSPSWFEGESVTDDFMCDEREQPADQERDVL